MFNLWDLKKKEGERYGILSEGFVSKHVLKNYTI